MVPVFDLSQTDGREDADEIATPEPIADPDGVMRANLVAQLDTFGYAIAHGDTDAFVIDSDARTVTVAESRPLVELARALAVVLADPHTQRHVHSPSSRPADPSAATQHVGPPAVRFDLGEHGPATATVYADLAAGRVYYTVRGTRIAGTWTVRVNHADDRDTLEYLSVEYGHDDGRHRFPDHERADRPVINGIDIVGGTGVAVVDVETLDPRRIACRKWLGQWHTAEAPARTIARMASVVRAISRDFLNRPDLPELHRVAIRQAADYRRAQEAARAAETAARIAELEAERARHISAAGRWADRAADVEQLDLFGGELTEAKV